MRWRVDRVDPSIQTSSAAEKILLVRPDHLGDVLLTTPALHALRRGRPEAHISLVVGSWSAGLLRGNPDVDEVIVCDLPWLARSGGGNWAALLSTLRQLRARRFDRIVSFRVAAKAACFSRLCSGGQRWGFDVAKSRWAWTHRVPYDWHGHVVDNYMELVKAIGAEPMPPRFRLFPETADQSAVAAFVDDTPIVVLGVTAGHADKFWLPERWAAVGDHLAAAGFRVLISGGSSEGEYVEAVRQGMGGAATPLVGTFNLLQFAGLLQRSFCLVTLDSFPMHVGAAVGVPVIALMGATSSSQWGPYDTGRPRLVIEPPPEVPRNAQAMQWISIEHVIEGFEQIRAQVEAK